jgi:hypothetical protein
MPAVINPLTEFTFEGKIHQVQYVESINVTTGVNCDVYRFITTPLEKDLAIITIQAGCHTPRQKVVQGATTIEGYLSGIGKLTIEDQNKTIKTFDVAPKTSKQFTISINLGEIMQWTASNQAQLMVYEICYPPYSDGRYENLSY